MQARDLKPNYDLCPLTIFKPDDSYRFNKQDIDAPIPNHSNIFIALVETMDESLYKDVQEEINESLSNFIISIAEPKSRPQFIHEYVITKETIKAATQIGYKISQIRSIAKYFNKYTKLPPEFEQMLDSLDNQENIISISILNTEYFIIRYPARFRHEPKFQEYEMKFMFARELDSHQYDDNLYDDFMQQEREIDRKRKTTNQQLFQQVTTEKRLCPIKCITNFRERVANDLPHYTIIEEYFLDPNDLKRRSQIPLDSAEVDILQKRKSRWLINVVKEYYLNPERIREIDHKTDDKIKQAIIQTAKYNSVAPVLNAQLKSTTVLRDYQIYSRNRVASMQVLDQYNSGSKQIFKLNSGMIVLPCGSGKSLQGVATACYIGCSVLIVTNSNLSSQQWKDQFMQFTTIDAKRIFIFSSQGDEVESDQLPIFFAGYHTVLIATYQMLTNDDQYSTDYAKIIRKLIRKTMWGAALFDEAHQMVSDTFKALYRVVERQNKETKEIVVKSDTFIRSYCKVALTATPLREDDKLEQEQKFIGCKLFESNWSDLSKQGHLAQLECAVINCPISRLFYSKYQSILERDDTVIKLSNNKLAGMGQNPIGKLTGVALSVQQQQYTKETTDKVSKRLINYIGIFNPEKLRIANLLKNYHASLGHQIIIFCDLKEPIQAYARILDIPYIDGEVPEEERQFLISSLKDRRFSCIMLSRVGDTSLDMPEVNVLIEIGWQEGSNRQETQRIGRISRPKSSGISGYFYVLVTEKTHEERTSQKRRTYLQYNQGYSYASINSSEIQQICKLKHISLDQKVEDILKRYNEEQYFDEIVGMAQKDTAK